MGALMTIRWAIRDTLSAITGLFEPAPSRHLARVGERKRVENGKEKKMRATRAEKG
jgi:hypothetical protein